MIFAELMARETEDNLATAEVLLSSAIMGVIYAVLAGQPLVILGVTGPVAILLGTSYKLAESFDADYFPFFFWICIWAGLMHCVSAMVGLVNLVWKVTPFTSQIFELFIGISFIYLSLRDLIEPLDMGEGLTADRAAQYSSLVLGVMTCYIAWTLHFLESRSLFPRQGEKQAGRGANRARSEATMLQEQLFLCEILTSNTDNNFRTIRN